MARGRGTVISVVEVLLALLFLSVGVAGRETEEQLQQRIKDEQNPVRKAKYEIKLANLELAQVHDEYTAGQIEDGAKLLGTFVGEMKSAWKLLQGSGRKASRQPDGFRELEISLREDVRALQDLARAVSYFDRDPLLNASQQLEKMRFEVLDAQFPGGNPRTRKGSFPPEAGPGPADER